MHGPGRKPEQVNFPRIRRRADRESPVTTERFAIDVPDRAVEERIRQTRLVPDFANEAWQ